MAKGKTVQNKEIKHLPLILTGIWLFGVLVRFIMAHIFRHGPTVIIDESLYTNIARSLAAGEGIAYRSQPVPYLYIFYPLMLIPLYLFRLPFDLYRTTQLWNAMLMCSSVFPIFLFAKDYTRDKKKALLCAGIILLMPDMAMAGYLMTECVVWPLSIWLMFFSYRMIAGEKKTWRYGILTGVMSALLFWTKPGAVAMGAAILLTVLILAIRAKDNEKTKAAIVGIAVLLGMIIAFYLLYVFGFGYEMSVLGLYDKQLTKVNGKWILAVAEDTLLQLLLFAIACTGVYFIFPYAFYKDYSAAQKHFIIAFSAGLVVSAIGTAALVDMYQWNGSFTNMQLHLRYMAMYVPIMFVLSQDIRERKEKNGRGVYIALLVMTILIIFPGARIGFVRGESTSIDSMALSGYLKAEGRFSELTGIILLIITAFFVSSVLRELMKRGISKKLQYICTGFFAFLLLFNSISAYFAGNIPATAGIMQDAREANHWLEEQEGEVLGVTQKYYNNIKTYWEESQFRKPMQQVTIENLIVSLNMTDGVYKPFVPVDQAPNRGNHSTPKTNTFLLGATIAEHIELSKDVTAQETENKLFTLAQAEEGKPLADSMLFGLDENLLAEGNQAKLYIFDESRFDDGKLKLIVSAAAKKEGTTLEVTSGGKKGTIHLSTEVQDYELTFESGTPVFDAVGGDVEILTYRTE